MASSSPIEMQSEAQFRLLVDAVMDYAIFMLDPAGFIVSWNRGAERIKGYSAQEIIGQHFSTFYNEADRLDRKPERELEIAAAEGRYEEEGWRVRKDGSLLWASVVITALRDTLGELSGFAKVTRDLTDRKAALDQLRANHDELERRVADRTAELTRLNADVRHSESRYRTIINAMSAVVWTCTAKGESFSSTPSWADYTGMDPSDLGGWGWTKSIHDDDRARTIAHFRECLASGAPYLSEHRVRRADGQYRNVVARGFPLDDNGATNQEWAGVLIDVTDQRHLEEQLRQSQKMEAIGLLAGGVAHDFNNLLTIISGYSELLLSTMVADDEQRSSVLAISEAGTRAAGLTRQLLSFSRQAVMEPQVLNINTIVYDTERMLQRVIGEDIELRTVLDPTVGPVRVDPYQIGQVLMNLAVNARDAMPEGGQLTIQTQSVELDQAYADMHVEVDAGHFVLLTVADSGVGMTPEVRDRIFEPFFTTKGVGRGTGLGLSVVHGIIKQSQGHIGAYTELGLGTTFKIFLPLVRDSDTRARPSVHTLPAGAPYGSETILLVEDEAGVRQIAQLALNARGYTVLSASNGREALELVASSRVRIDLLLTDIVMPEMGGRPLAEALVSRFPSMRVLYMSGYTDDTVVRHGILEAEVAFLQKPYTPSVLLRKVRQVLDGA